MMIEVEKILDLKAQGWSDIQIRKHLGWSHDKFMRYIRFMYNNNMMRIDALTFVFESIHRLRWARMDVLAIYDELKKKGDRKGALNAMRRITAIDIAVAKICKENGWSPDDLMQHLTEPKKRDRKREKEEAERVARGEPVRSLDDLYGEYRQLAGTDA